jgi:DNA end-binding protein Ku
MQPVKAPQPSNVINLMDALRRSIAAEKGQAAKAGAAEQPASAAEAPPKRRAAAAAAPRDKARKSPRPKKPT